MYNQITVMGFVGVDPDLRYIQDGTPVANFTLAVNNRWTSAAGENMEETLWFRITTWRRQAEAVAEYVRKGQLVLVSGAVKPPFVWTDEAGQAQARLEVTAQLVKFLPGNQRTGESIEETEEVDSVAAEG